MEEEGFRLKTSIKLTYATSPFRTVLLKYAPIYYNNFLYEKIFEYFLFYCDKHKQF